MKTAEETLDDYYAKLRIERKDSLDTPIAAPSWVAKVMEEYANQSREEGSGKLEEVFRNFIRTEQLTAKWEEFLSNNNH